MGRGSGPRRDDFRVLPVWFQLGQDHSILPVCVVEIVVGVGWVGL